MSEDEDIRIEGLLETVYVDEESVRVVPDSWCLTQLLVSSRASPERPNSWTPQSSLLAYLTPGGTPERFRASGQSIHLFWDASRPEDHDHTGLCND